MGAYQTLSARDLDALRANTAGLTLIDVRTPEETWEGVIDGALQINIYDPTFADQIEKLDKSKPYVVYCRSGSRSAAACGLMASRGFKQLYNLTGGYMGWAMVHR